MAAPPANAGAFKISLYLSAVPDATERLIGSLNVVGAVASALPLTVTGTVVVPSSTPADTYYLRPSPMRRARSPTCREPTISGPRTARSP